MSPYESNDVNQDLHNVVSFILADPKKAASEQDKRNEALQSTSDADAKASVDPLDVGKCLYTEYKRRQTEDWESGLEFATYLTEYSSESPKVAKGEIYNWFLKSIVHAAANPECRDQAASSFDPIELFYKTSIDLIKHYETLRTGISSGTLAITAVVITIVTSVSVGIPYWMLGITLVLVGIAGALFNLRMGEAAGFHYTLAYVFRRLIIARSRNRAIADLYAVSYGTHRGTALVSEKVGYGNLWPVSQYFVVAIGVLVIGLSCLNIVGKPRVEEIRFCYFSSQICPAKIIMTR